MSNPNRSNDHKPHLLSAVKDLGRPLVPADFRRLDRSGLPVDRIERESLSSWKDAWIRLKSSRLVVISMWVLALIIVMAIIGPLLSPHDISTNRLELTNQPPSGEFWFGTDNLGRDMFARTWAGAQISLQVGLYAALLDLVIGVIYGGIMGFVGGRVDEVMNKIAEILYSIPYLLVVILLIVVMEPSLVTIVIALSVTGWINMAWIVRGQIMQLKNQEYALASRSLGAGSSRILFRHLIPNALGPIIVTLTLTVPSAIFSEAFLSFLGLGVQSPAASWGTMIESSLNVWQIYPWELFFPAFFISLTMLAFNIFGDGLRDAFDPKMKN